MVACHRQHPHLRESRAPTGSPPRPPSVISASELAARPEHEFGSRPVEEIRESAKSSRSSAVLSSTTSVR
jgi:hypothetical protein